MEAMSVLVVEDEAILAILLTRTLTRHGCLCLPYLATGEEAIQSFETNHPDIILMDIRLAGGMDGIEAVNAIHAIEPKALVLYLTGYTNEEITLRAQQSGMLGLLHKPYEYTELLAILNRIAVEKDCTPLTM